MKEHAWSPVRVDTGEGCSSFWEGTWSPDAGDGSCKGGELSSVGADTGEGSC